MRVINVRDRRHNWIGEWDVEPFTLNLLYLQELDIGRTVIYIPIRGEAEAGTISSFKEDRVWVRFGHGITGAACKPEDLRFAIRPRDGNPDR
jgi:hypothetical protein